MDRASAAPLQPGTRVVRGARDRREQLAEILGSCEREPNRAELHRMFAQSVKLIRDLAETGQIPSEAAKTLHETMATLYFSTLLADFSVHYLGAPHGSAHRPDFVRWLYSNK